MKIKSILTLIIVIGLNININAQEAWGEKHSIIHPNTINGVKVNEFTKDSVVSLFGQPNEIKNYWSEYDDEEFEVYKYSNSAFYFHKHGPLNIFSIYDNKLNNVPINVNGHFITESIQNLKNDYPKSFKAKKENKISIYMLSSSWCLLPAVIDFQYDNNNQIESIRLINLN